MAFNNNITPGRPPLLWSDVKEAFDKVNENFDEIVAATGLGITPVNFETLTTNVSPTTDQTYQLGDQAHKWKSVHTSSWSSIPGSELNGLWAGPAHIKGIGSTIDLPLGSTVDGNLIIDPINTFYKTVQVDGDAGGEVVANQFADTLNLNSGIAMQLVIDSSAEIITFNNTGVTSLTAGLGVNVSDSTGNITVSNTGVVSLANSLTLPPTATGRAPGAGIIVSADKGSGINITNTGVLDIQQGSFILVEKNTTTGVITITNGAPAGNTFGQIFVNADPLPIVANSPGAGFTIANAVDDNTIILTKDSVNDRITIAVNPVFDLRGSVFGDDSTKIVDAVENKVYAEFFGNLTGDVTGNLTGDVTGNVSGTAGIATTVTLVADNSTNAAHFITFVDTATGNENIKTDTSLTYNPSTNILTAGTFNGAVTGNVTGSVTGNIFTNLIDSADSSQIVVTPLMRFSSDVVVENEVFVRGSKIILLNDLKAVVAASASFADFQTRIAALV